MNTESCEPRPGGRHPTAAVPLLLALLALSWSPVVPALDVEEHPALVALVDEMVSKHAYERETLVGWLEEARLRDDIIEAVYRPRENLPWHEYRKSFVIEDRIRKGRDFWHENADSVLRASSEYGVPPEIIVAIIGVETRYGKHLGRYRVLDALVTLTLRYPERSEFFRKELVEFLLLTRELGVQPPSVKGSYAGAMGVPQFISSSYRRYAVDFDGDHIRNLDDLDDAIGSVGNFLKQHGWRRGEPIIGDARIEGSMYAWLENTNNEPRVSIRQLARYGILPLTQTDELALATLIRFEGEDGPIYRLGYNNFYVLTRYNRSKNYSMAVVELADAIRQRYGQH